MWEALALSFALAIDSAAVSAARALGAESRRELVILPLVFGGFQSAMATLGWLGGAGLVRYLGGWDVWIAFALLVAIGAKMIWDAARATADAPVSPGTMMVYLGLGVATSIDAGAAGITLPQIHVAPWLAIMLIGVITAASSAVGHLAGRALAGKFGKRLGMGGGIVLIGIAIKMVVG
ncbi:MAG: manganese efflux pump [Kofleriaceae bacterium]